MPALELRRRAFQRTQGLQQHAMQVLAHVARDGGLMAAVEIAAHQSGLLAVAVKQLRMPNVSEGAHVGEVCDDHFSVISAVQMLKGVCSHAELAARLISMPAMRLPFTISCNLGLPGWWPLDEWLDLLVACLAHRGEHGQQVLDALLAEPSMRTALLVLPLYTGIHPSISPIASRAIKHLVMRTPPAPPEFLAQLVASGLCRAVVERTELNFGEPQEDEPAQMARLRSAATDDLQDVGITLAAHPTLGATFEAGEGLECARVGEEKEEQARTLKAEANRQVKAGAFGEAKRTYSAALTLLPLHCELAATLRSNRALCHLKLLDPAAAERDATIAIAFLMNEADENESLRTLLAKCCFRRATALADQHRVDDLDILCIRRAEVWASEPRTVPTALCQLNPTLRPVLCAGACEFVVSLCVFCRRIWLCACTRMQATRTIWR